jgi:thiopeptide-type bacteriocin biosynthesis protein
MTNPTAPNVRSGRHPRQGGTGRHPATGTDETGRDRGDATTEVDSGAAGLCWVSVHAFYHGDLDVLLLDGVAPVVADLRRRSLVDGFFYLRYWDGGQHLRVRLRTGNEDAVRRLALDGLHRYLSACPSKDFLELERYPEYAAVLAADEGLTNHLRSPMPNNTVHEIAYRPETDRYGHGAELAAVERHFVESSRIALGLVGAGANRDQRHTAALSAILLAWHGASPTPTSMPPVPGEFEARYRRTRRSLRVLADRVAEIAAGTSTLPAEGALSAWWRSIGALADSRVADLCAHLFCNRLGLTVADERYLRYLAARTSTSGDES